MKKIKSVSNHGYCVSLMSEKNRFWVTVEKNDQNISVSDKYSVFEQANSVFEMLLGATEVRYN